MSEALLRRQGSLAAALEHAGVLAATRQAYYGKLRRLPLPLSVALLRAAADRLRPLLPPPAPAARPDGDVSTHKLFVDVQEELLSACKLVPAAELAALVSGAGAAELGQRLIDLLRASWRPRYRKARDSKPRPPRRRARQSGAHTSVYRLQQKHRASRKNDP